MAVTSSMSGRGNAGHYTVGDRELPVGCTLGAPKVVAVVKATGAIQEVFGIESGKVLLGSIAMRHYDRETEAFVAPGPHGSFALRPHCQDHAYDLVNGLSVEESVFVLNDDSTRHGDGPPAVYYRVTLHNPSKQQIVLATLVSAVLRGDTEHDVVVTFDRRLRGFVVWNESERKQVRMLACSRKPHSYETTLDNSKATLETIPNLTGETKAPYDPLGLLRIDTDLEPGQSAEIYLLVTVGSSRARVQKQMSAAPTADKARTSTAAWYETMLAKTVVFTPDRHVNQGVMWSKVNMLRVLASTPTGWAFTNNPTKSSNAVGRDTAWFAMGADYLDQEFVRDSLWAFCERQERDGLITEWYDTRTGDQDDYGLNINDNTPLLIMALWHHYNLTGDVHFLRQVYPVAVKAGDCILRQRNEQGLVFCTATGTSGWGIVGWRNVIPNYRLSGATTELNSECFGALRDLSEMARVLGSHEESRRFLDEANMLREAINKHLFDAEAGVYLLNIDVQGLPHAEITADLVFPVIFGVADTDAASRVITRLSNEDFWTSSGIRTVPRDAPNYSPDAASGLMGGIWVGVSFWYAFAAASHSQAFMAQALSRTFQNYATDPKARNTVPGQFSEWLHGESLSNRGMMLSPWFPPRYLWAAVEGMAGWRVDAGQIHLKPRLAPDWKWLAVRNVAFRGISLSWLAVRLPQIFIYSTFEHSAIETPTFRYTEDVTDQLVVSGESLIGIALRSTNRLMLFVGNTHDRTVAGHLRVKLDLPSAAAYHLRRFDSLASEWKEEPDLILAQSLERGFSFVVEREGFVLMELNLAV